MVSCFTEDNWFNNELRKKEIIQNFISSTPSRECHPSFSREGPGMGINNSMRSIEKKHTTACHFTGKELSIFNSSFSIFPYPKYPFTFSSTLSLILSVFALMKLLPVTFSYSSIYLSEMDHTSSSDMSGIFCPSLP